MSDKPPSRTPPLAHFDGRQITPAEPFPPATDESLEFMLSDALRQVGKPTLRKIVTEHCSDIHRRIAAKTMLTAIRRSGFDVLRVKPPAEAHSAPSTRRRDETS